MQSRCHHGWLFHTQRAMEWGARGEMQVLRDPYDGVLFVDSVSLPVDR